MICKYVKKYKERIPQSENQSYSISIMAIHTISEDIALKTVTINIFLSRIAIQLSIQSGITVCLFRIINNSQTNDTDNYE